MLVHNLITFSNGTNIICNQTTVGGLNCNTVLITKFLDRNSRLNASYNLSPELIYRTDLSAEFILLCKQFSLFFLTQSNEHFAHESLVTKIFFNGQSVLTVQNPELTTCFVNSKIDQFDIDSIRVIIANNCPDSSIIDFSLIVIVNMNQFNRHIENKPVTSGFMHIFHAIFQNRIDYGITNTKLANGLLSNFISYQLIHIRINNSVSASGHGHVSLFHNNNSFLNKIQ